MLLLPMGMMGAGDILIGASTILSNTNANSVASTLVSDSISPAQDDILFAICGARHDTAVVISAPSTTLANATITFVEDDAVLSASIGMGLRVSRITFSGPPGTGTVTLNSDTTYQRSLIIAKVARGWNTSSPIGQTAVNNKGSGTSLATTFGGAPDTTSLIMSAHVESTNDAGVTQPSGHTLLVDTAIGTSMQYHLSYRLTGGTATALTWSNVNNTQAAAVSWEVKD